MVLEGEMWAILDEAETLLKAGDKCCTDSDCPTTAPFCNPYAGFVCSNGLNFATHSPSRRLPSAAHST